MPEPKTSEKLHAACDECRESTQPPVSVANRVINMEIRNKEVKVLRREPDV